MYLHTGLILLPLTCPINLGPVSILSKVVSEQKNEDTIHFIVFLICIILNLTTVSQDSRVSLENSYLTDNFNKKCELPGRFSWNVNSPL